MKKIILFLSLISFSLAQATIIVKDILDFTFTPTNTLFNFDFNSDGTIEFSFEDLNGVSTFFNANDVNFVSSGSIDSGYGWDVMKFLSEGSTISNLSLFDAQGDAYINPMWANANDIFPAGDSYIGTKFKIGTTTHYGWILISSTGGATGTITIKSYAYNNVPDASITAGQTTLGLNDFNADFEVKIYPNPTTDFVFIKTEKDLNSISVYNAKGEMIIANVKNNRIDFSLLSSGIYFLNFVSDDNKHLSIKLIKE